jgi:hypothetical protein
MDQQNAESQEEQVNDELLHRGVVARAFLNLSKCHVETSSMDGSNSGGLRHVVQTFGGNKIPRSNVAGSKARSL